MNTTDSATLGVSVVTITDEMAQYYNLPTAGVMVQEVVHNIGVLESVASIAQQFKSML